MLGRSKYEVVPLEELAKAEFRAWMENSWQSAAFPSIIEGLWMYEEYGGLYNLISEVIAEHVDWYLATERGEEFISTGMATGTLSLEFLRRVLHK